jgi:hypothetical protein
MLKRRERAGAICVFQEPEIYPLKTYRAAGLVTHCGILTGQR